ncbi:uncharacterized protein [Paramormyrops kingsleyae]|uniref:uncharacterized protein isoform X2 n=1 Tax=Paramormyrops kingsleyae TaxID=1676925 RepID=UPI003B96C141
MVCGFCYNWKRERTQENQYVAASRMKYVGTWASEIATSDVPSSCRRRLERQKRRYEVSKVYKEEQLERSTKRYHENEVYRDHVKQSSILPAVYITHSMATT